MACGAGREGRAVCQTCSVGFKHQLFGQAALWDADGLTQKNEWRVLVCKINRSVSNPCPECDWYNLTSSHHLPFSVVPSSTLLARWFKKMRSLALWHPQEPAGSVSGFRSLQRDVSKGREGPARANRQKWGRGWRWPRTGSALFTQEERETVRGALSVSDRSQRIDRCVWRQGVSRHRANISIPV